jgi:diguanylate cyclase (GGDEF)-like protein
VIDATSHAEDGVAMKYQAVMESRMEELERRNQMLEAEVERLRIYRDYAYTDPTTQIPNRRCYYERLLQEISRARRTKRPLTLALLDLDYFRQINDAVGHHGGDELLKFFAQFVRENLRHEDIVCRIGGDEFGIILPETPANKARVALDRIREKLDQLDITVGGRSRITMTFSCGVSDLKPDYLPEDLIEEADHALYSAKATGRSRIVVAQAMEALVSQVVH